MSRGVYRTRQIHRGNQPVNQRRFRLLQSTIDQRQPLFEITMHRGQEDVVLAREMQI